MGRENEPTRDGFSRRQFLQGAGGAAAGSVLVGIPALVRGDEAAGTTATGLARYPASGAKITLKVNGQSASVAVTPDTTLLHAVREWLHLTGTKEVCDRGACGACTVHVDGRSINSCMLLAVDAIGHEITTIEGLGTPDRRDPVQQAFIEHDACQCGYCIPGFVMRSRAFLNETPGASREQIKHGLCGNICRCAAYTRILDAVASAAKGGPA
jgi:aerobic-type carbon monoxide dehydrogenase small subunit (CoxS/CutS family)